MRRGIGTTMWWAEGRQLWSTHGGRQVWGEGGSGRKGTGLQSWRRVGHGSQVGGERGRWRKGTPE
jgi:hypothetical protein